MYLPTRETVQVVVMDQMGRIVKELIPNQIMDAGFHTITLTNHQLSGGILYIHVRTLKEKLVKKVILLKDGKW